jgi:hypothetical protein
MVLYGYMTPFSQLQPIDSGYPADILRHHLQHPTPFPQHPWSPMQQP